jgi:hypothetical protein
MLPFPTLASAPRVGSDVIFQWRARFQLGRPRSRADGSPGQEASPYLAGLQEETGITEATARGYRIVARAAI